MRLEGFYQDLRSEKQEWFDDLEYKGRGFSFFRARMDSSQSSDKLLKLIKNNEKDKATRNKVTFILFKRLLSQGKLGEAVEFDKDYGLKSKLPYELLRTEMRLKLAEKEMDLKTLFVLIPKVQNLLTRLKLEEDSCYLAAQKRFEAFLPLAWSALCEKLFSKAAPWDLFVDSALFHSGFKAGKAHLSIDLHAKLSIFRKIITKGPSAGDGAFFEELLTYALPALPKLIFSFNSPEVCLERFQKEENPELAFSYIERAMELGSVEAELLYAEFLLLDSDFPQEALAILEKHFFQHKQAKYLLGLAHLFAKGVSRNLELAKAYLQAAGIKDLDTEINSLRKARENYV